MTGPQPIMPRRGRLTLLFLVVVAAGLTIDRLWDRLPAAPPSTVTTFDGETVSLAQGPLVLNFWASWCLPCRREFPALNAFAVTHPAIRVVGVAVDDTEVAAKAFAAEMGVAYPVGWDEDGTIAEAFALPGLPVTLAIDAEGRVVRRVNGEIDAEDLEEMARLLGA